MEISVQMWLIGIAAALICGWLFAKDLGKEMLQYRVVTVAIFTISIALMEFAITIKNPEVSGLVGTIAVMGIVVIGAIVITSAGFFALVGYEAPEKAFYIIAAILLIVGAVITSPSVARAVFTAGSC